MPLEHCALPALLAATIAGGVPTLAPQTHTRTVRAAAQAGAQNDVQEASAPDFATFAMTVDADAALPNAAAFAAAGQASTIGLTAIEASGNASSSASRGPGSFVPVTASGESSLSVTFELSEPALVTLFARVEAARSLPGSDVAAEVRLTGPEGDVDLRSARLQPVGKPDLLVSEERSDASVLPAGAYTLTAAARATTTATPEKSAGAVFQLSLTLAPAPVCLGDLTGDGVVDGADLAQVISKWGMRFRATDLNGDGVTNAQDLCVVLGAWGPCGQVVRAGA